MVVDLHTSQIQGFFDGPVDHLFALPMLANYVGSKVDRIKAQPLFLLTQVAFALQNVGQNFLVAAQLHLFIRLAIHLFLTKQLLAKLLVMLKDAHASLSMT